MALCFYSGINDVGMPVFGRWVLNFNQEDYLVSFCKDALGDIYSDMWIDPEYFDDRYLKSTDKFYAEVGMTLYPRYTNLADVFAKAGIKYPKTKEDWDRHRDIVYGVIHRDITKSRKGNRYPIYIVVKGKKTKCTEKITSVQVVPRLPSKGDL